ncbi:MAG: dephospho-CoA kinase [Thiobacillus sp.]
MLRVGLTGGIGSGKSAVAELFVAHGAALIDTDQIAHTLTQPGTPELVRIAEAFEHVLTPTGELDRARLRRVVFADASARQRLEAILHPAIRVRVRAELSLCSAPVAVIAIPLLIETGEAYRDLLDRVLVVDCPESLQVERTIARSGLTRSEVEAVMAAQASRAARLAAADDVIDNSGDRAALVGQVAHLYDRYQAQAALIFPHDRRQLGDPV